MMTARKHPMSIVMDRQAGGDQVKFALRDTTTNLVISWLFVASLAAEEKMLGRDLS
jgi:hypothetical protein